MNEDKLKRLFAAARNETTPVPPDDFAADMLRMARQESPAIEPARDGLLDIVDGMFPRIAVAAVALIALCVAADYALTVAGMPGLGDGLSLFSAQWFFI